MKPAPFAYVRPGSLDEALAALAGDPGAKVLAGGQSLVPLLSMRLAAPSRLVDINGLPGPRPRRRRRRRGPGRGAGPARRRAGLRRGTPRASRWSRWRWPTSRTPTIRNRGTTVGSIVHADAAAEMPVVLRAARAARSTWSVRARPPHDRRPTTCSSARWSRRWRHDEIAVAAFFPALAAGRRRRVRGDRPPARRLRAVRCRGLVASTATRSWRRASATCRSATCRPSST